MPIRECASKSINLLTKEELECLAHITGGVPNNTPGQIWRIDYKDLKAVLRVAIYPYESFVKTAGISYISIDTQIGNRIISVEDTYVKMGKRCVIFRHFPDFSRLKTGTADIVIIDRIRGIKEKTICY